MLNKKQILEIKEHLSKAQNPLFFFDNDQDGLCSFLLLQKYIGRGKGVPIKSFPELSLDYFRKIRELNADYIFILDKHAVSEEFFLEVEKINIPVVWIDHHKIDKKNIPKFVNYYNPIFNKISTDEPVTALCYQITQREEDSWIALAGCISDRYLPPFYSEFKKKFPELVTKPETAANLFYKSEIGKIAKIFGLGLKDSTTNVIRMVKFLMKAKNPSEVLEENSKNYSMHLRYNQITSKYSKLLDKASSLELEGGKLLFFQYGGDLSISSDLSNELNYLFPDKIIVVIYTRGIKVNISMRGKNSRGVFLKAINNIDGASGGGHEDAVGGQIKVEDLEKFKNNLEKVVS